MVCAHSADSGHFHVPVILPANRLAGSRPAESVTPVGASIFPEPAPERILHPSLLEYPTAHTGALVTATIICKAAGPCNRPKAAAAGNHSRA